MCCDHNREHSYVPLMISKEDWNWRWKEDQTLALVQDNNVIESSITLVDNPGQKFVIAIIVHYDRRRTGDGLRGEQQPQHSRLNQRQA